MPQGKLKAKTKLPDSFKKKQKLKGLAFTRRSNAPIRPKKLNFTEQQKIKQVISKTVNKSAEDEIRAKATESSVNLSKAQEAVAKHHQPKDDSNSVRTS